jgi:pimeloyl-ACP methyl ester carboxylesterase
MSSRVLIPAFETLTRPDWLPREVWPFESFGVPSGGSRLAVTDIGRGPTLLLVHVGLWSFVWRDLVLRLAPDFRCVFFDAPGNGRTEDRPGARVSIQLASQAISDVITALSLTDLTLVMHDLAGPTALASIAEVPERVRGIVAMNTFGWRPDVLPLRIMLALMGSAVIREIDAATGFLPRIASSAFGIGRRLDDRSRAAFLAGVGPRGRRAFHNYVRDVRYGYRLYPAIDRAIGGPLAGTPFLSIFGEHNDPFGFQPRWKSRFPHARQEIVSGGNHFPMCDDPDFCARVIREWHREHVS